MIHCRATSILGDHYTALFHHVLYCIEEIHVKVKTVSLLDPRLRCKSQLVEIKVEALHRKKVLCCNNITKKSFYTFYSC